MIDDENSAGSLARFKFQAELLCYTLCHEEGIGLVC